MVAPTPPASQPAFATRRLLLTPRTSADNESCLEMDSDPEVIRFIAVPWTDAAEHKAFITARTRGPYPHGQGYWTVRQRSEPARFLGWILLTPLDAVGPDIERVEGSSEATCSSAKSRPAILHSNQPRSDHDP
jgi:RimJ/RimL family protein N-acetyltransferase